MQLSTSFCMNEINKSVSCTQCISSTCCSFGRHFLDFFDQRDNPDLAHGPYSGLTSLLYVHTSMYLYIQHILNLDSGSTRIKIIYFSPLPCLLAIIEEALSATPNSKITEPRVSHLEYSFTEAHDNSCIHIDIGVERLSCPLKD